MYQSSTPVNLVACSLKNRIADIVKITGVILLLLTFILPQKTIAQFTPGRLVVEQSQGITNAAGATSMLEYQTNGAAGAVIPLPTVTSGNINRMTESGTATSASQLNLSLDGRYITMSGYDVAMGTANVVSLDSSRVVCRVDANGIISTTVIAGNPVNAGSLDWENNFRSVITDSGTNYWLCGATHGTNGDGTDGVKFVSNNSSSVTVQTCSLVNIENASQNENIRVVKMYNGQLYYSTQSGVSGVYSVGAGIPTGGGNSTTAIMTNSNNLSPNSFVILPVYGPVPGTNYWVAYVADDGANGGVKGIYKYYSNDGVTWVSAGSYTALGQKFHGLTGAVPIAGVDTTGINGINVKLYATDEKSDIYAITDKATGFSAAMAASGTMIVGTGVLAKSLLGIAFAPLANAISITNPGNQNFCGTGSLRSVNFTSSSNTNVNWVITNSSIAGLSNQFGNSAINFTPASAGTATVTAYAYYGDHASASISFTITVSGNTWTGATSTDWFDPTNWSCGIIPTATSDVIISNSVNQPSLLSNAAVHNISLQPSSGLTLNNNTLTINGTYNGSSTGVINGSSAGSLVIGGTADTLYFSSTGDTLLNLTINDGASVVLGSPLYITSTGTLAVGTLTGTGAALATGGFLTLVSDNNGSARVGSVPNGNGGGFMSTINGNVNVQCYIHSTNSAISVAHRAWRLLTAPVTSNNAAPIPSIYNAWQNGGVYTPGMGTFITGPPAMATGGSGNGMDAGINGNYSAYTWNTTTQQLGAITNTQAPISTAAGSADNIGYFIFIRGDRDPATNQNPNYATINNTTLNASGQLQLGDQVFSSTSGIISATANGLSLIGNPYACSVDFSELAGDNIGYSTSYLSNIINRIYVWDANLTGSAAVGGYVCIDDANNTNGFYTKSLGDAGIANPADLSIQSGQSFFVQTQNAGPASITFKELAKSTVNNYVYRPANIATTAPDQLNATLSLLNPDSSTSLTDGIVAQFRNDYCNCVDDIDAPKFSNSDEMFSLARGGKQLSIERRNSVTANDTLFLNLKQTQQRSYQFKLTGKFPNNPALEADLEDSYTGIHTPLNTNGTNIVNFSIDANAASKVQNRFMVVMGISSALPVTISSCKAIQQGADILVQWTVLNEAAITEYEVQKSIDGVNFTTISTVTVDKDGSSDTYDRVDSNEVSGTNEYRIVDIAKNGSLAYSQTMSVDINNTAAATIVVYPNPVNAGDNVNLKFTSMEAGVYGLRLINNIGQVELTTSIDHEEGNSTKSLLLPKYILRGAYQLEIVKPNGSNTETALIVN